MAQTVLFEETSNGTESPFKLVDLPPADDRKRVAVGGSYCVFCQQEFENGDDVVLVDGEPYHEECWEDDDRERG